MSKTLSQPRFKKRKRPASAGDDPDFPKHLLGPSQIACWECSGINVGDRHQGLSWYQRSLLVRIILTPNSFFFSYMWQWLSHRNPRLANHPRLYPSNVVSSLGARNGFPWATTMRGFGLSRDNRRGACASVNFRPLVRALACVCGLLPGNARHSIDYKTDRYAG